MLAVVSVRPALAENAPRRPVPAYASNTSKPDDRRRALAEQRFREGRVAYGAGRYRDAIEAFQAADAIVPSAALSFNSALAYEHLPDVAGALRSYREYLRRSETPDNTARILARINELEKQLVSRGVQQVTVLSQPPGAGIVVDGHAMGITPWTGELSPGSHDVTLTLKGYRTISRSFALAKEHALDVSLELPVEANPAPIKLSLRTLGAHAGDPASVSQRRDMEKPHPLGAWPWISLGVGGGSLLAAGIFELSRRSTEGDAQHDPTQIGYAAKLDSMDGKRRTARIFAAAGGGLLLTSGILFLIDSNAQKQERELSVSVDDRDVSLSYRSAF
jgi:tetratricopeptide (TPR) repeat protein